MARSLVRELVSSAAVFALAACAPADDDPAGTEVTSVQRSAVFAGTPSPASEDYAIKIYGVGGATTAPPPCSGVLVAPTLLLTARHCVTAGLLNNSGRQCVLGTDPFPKDAFKIYVGSRVDQARQFSVERVVIDYDSDDCSNDIAGLELNEPVTGVSFPPLELDVPPNVGDAVTTAAWGKTADAPTAIPNERQRAAGTVLGLTAGSYTNATGDTLVFIDGFIVTSINVCDGDSGSPLFDGRGALLGVMSGGVYPSTVTTKDASCVGGLGGYVPLYRHTGFVERLFQSIGKMPPRAGKPVPSDLGGPCKASNECNSNYCVSVGPRSMCSKPCTTDAECGGALACTDTGAGSSVCLDVTTPPTGETSCAVVTAGGAPASKTVGVTAAVSVLLLLGRARRRVGGRNAPLRIARSMHGHATSSPLHVHSIERAVHSQAAFATDDAATPGNLGAGGPQARWHERCNPSDRWGQPGTRRPARGARRQAGADSHGARRTP